MFVSNALSVPFHNLVLSVATTLLLSLSAPPVGAQGLTSINVMMTYTGSLGPVSSERPLCLCAYNDADLHDQYRCYISYENHVAVQISAFGPTNYFLMAFVDLDGNEFADSNEPFEIYRDRAEAPADAVTASKDVTSVDITFGDENLSPRPTASPTDTPTPTVIPTATATPTPTATHTPTSVPSTPTMAPCTGDCDGSHSVTVDEILTLVNIALGNAAVDACRAGDRDANHAIEVDEILQAVINAQEGCPR